MKICKKIVIIGLGLIGGSLGIALKKKKAASEIIGVSRRPSTLNAARKRRAVDWCTKDVKKAVKDADIIILAAPVDTIVDFAPKLAKLASEKCIISDVGSTKQKIVNAFERKGINFVGAHPLAGSEKKGVKFADGTLFENSLCILTPTAKTDKKSLWKIRKLWQIAGARAESLSPSKHDSVIALVSHLPHIVAFSLVDTLPQRLFKFAAEGFKDTTRIAASDAKIWQDIFLSNRRPLLKNIDDFQKRLNILKSLIRGKDRVKLHRLLKQIGAKRSKI